LPDEKLRAEAEAPAREHGSDVTGAIVVELVARCGAGR
jgi:hypothetical protein